MAYNIIKCKVDLRLKSVISEERDSHLNVNKLFWNVQRNRRFHEFPVQSAS